MAPVSKWCPCWALVSLRTRLTMMTCSILKPSLRWQKKHKVTQLLQLCTRRKASAPWFRPAGRGKRRRWRLRAGKPRKETAAGWSLQPGWNGPVYCSYEEKATDDCSNGRQGRGGGRVPCGHPLITSDHRVLINFSTASDCNQQNHRGN